MGGEQRATWCNTLHCGCLLRQNAKRRRCVGAQPHWLPKQNKQNDAAAVRQAIAHATPHWVIAEGAKLADISAGRLLS